MLNAVLCGALIDFDPAFDRLQMSFNSAAAVRRNSAKRVDRSHYSVYIHGAHLQSLGMKHELRADALFGSLYIALCLARRLTFGSFLLEARIVLAVEVTCTVAHRPFPRAF